MSDEEFSAHGGSEACPVCGIIRTNAEPWEDPDDREPVCWDCYQAENRRRTEEACKRAAEIVATWPEWKRGLIEHSHEATIPVPRTPIVVLRRPELDPDQRKKNTHES